jgi:hypothetical protein
MGLTFVIGCAAEQKSPPLSLAPSSRSRSRNTLSHFPLNDRPPCIFMFLWMQRMVSWRRRGLAAFPGPQLPMMRVSTSSERGDDSPEPHTPLNCRQDGPACGNGSVSRVLWIWGGDGCASRR